jgi:hypothetical protein
MEFLHARSVEQAVALLRRREANGIRVLVLNLEAAPEDDLPLLRFRRLGDAMRRHSYAGAFILRGCRFDEQERLNSEDAEGFFRVVAAEIPSITLLDFRNCRVFPRLFEHLSASPSEGRGQYLRNLRFSLTPLCDQSVAQLGRALRGGRLPVENLYLDSCGVDARGFETICEGLVGNSRLRWLIIREGDRTAWPEHGTFGAAASEALAASNVRRLSLDSPVFTTPRSLREFVQGLKANYVLEELGLEGEVVAAGAPLFEDLLSSFNCTLRRLYIVPGADNSAQERIGLLLRRNARVRSARDGLAAGRYRVGPPALWADALARIGSKPDLIFKFLAGPRGPDGSRGGAGGNRDAFARHVLLASHAGHREPEEEPRQP